MNSMTVISQSEQFKTYFQNFSEDFDVHFEAPSTISKNDGLVIVEHSNTFNATNFLSTTMTKATVLIGCDFSKINCALKEQLEDACSANPIFQGIIDISLPHRLHFPLLQQMFARSLDQLNAFGNDLNRLVSHALTELQRVKRLHEKLVPFRSGKINGITLFSKYAAGERSGSEFIDVLAGDRQVTLVLFSASSYLASSLVMGQIENYKIQKKTSIEHIPSLIEAITKDLSGLGQIKMDSKQRALDLMIFNLDLRTMMVSGYCFGPIQIISSSNHTTIGNNYPVEPLFLEQAKFSFRLERGEKLLIASSGVVRNSDDLIEGKSVISFVKDQFGKPPKSLLNELFYQLKKDNDSMFLKYDASAIYFEVDNNVMVQI